MTTDPTDLLRQAETYLSALHTSVARHDNLGADLTCHGCQLRERIAAALAEASVTAAPCHPCGCPRRFNRHADGCPARERIAEVIRESGVPSGSGYREADAVLAILPAPAARAAELPLWEAVYEPGNVSDYLIGYANSEAAAKGAAEAWMLSQKDEVDRLEWVPDERLATGRYDQWTEILEHHDEGVPTGPGIIVRRRVEVATPTAPADRAAVLLARAESYLAALHGSVARHDNLGENLACAGCELRNQDTDELLKIANPPAEETA